VAQSEPAITISPAGARAIPGNPANGLTQKDCFVRPNQVAYSLRAVHRAISVVSRLYPDDVGIWAGAVAIVGA
jgi:hypothetical protein